MWCVPTSNLWSSLFDWVKWTPKDRILLSFWPSDEGYADENPPEGSDQSLSVPTEWLQHVLILKGNTQSTLPSSDRYPWSRDVINGNVSLQYPRRVARRSRFECEYQPAMPVSLEPDCFNSTPPLEYFSSTPLLRTSEYLPCRILLNKTDVSKQKWTEIRYRCWTYHVFLK